MLQKCPLIYFSNPFLQSIFPCVAYLGCHSIFSSLSILCCKAKISQMDVDILHPPISLLSFLTNTPAHSFLPTKPSYIDLIFSLELDSQNFLFYNPSHAPTLSSSTKSPIFKMSKLFHIPHNMYLCINTLLLLFSIICTVCKYL